MRRSTGKILPCGLIGCFLELRATYRSDNLLCRIDDAICIAGMLLGLAIDLWRSPFPSIADMCSGDAGLLQLLLFHVQVMPFAHVGMAVGVPLCAARHVSRASKGNMLLTAVIQAVLMLIAECAALLLAKTQSALPVMLTMAVVMLVMGMSMAVVGRIMGGGICLNRVMRKPAT